MQKISSRALIVLVFRFLRTEFGTAVRHTWLPMAIIACSGLFVASAVRITGHEVVWPLLGAVVGIAATTTMVTSLLRLIFFGDRKPGDVDILQFGRTELGVIGLWLLSRLSGWP